MTVRESIESVLDNMMTIDGITGAMVSDVTGNVQGSRMPAVYDDELLSEVSAMLVSSGISLQEMGLKDEETVYHYDNIRLLVKDLECGFLIIMSLPTMSVPMLHVATNVTRKKIVGILTQSEAGTDKATGQGQPSRASSTSAASEQSSIRPIPKQAIDLLRNSLAKAIGPAAVVVIKRAAEKLGGGIDSIDRKKAKELINALAGRIDDSDERSTFTRAANRILSHYNVTEKPSGNIMDVF